MYIYIDIVIYPSVMLPDKVMLLRYQKNGAGYVGVRRGKDQFILGFFKPNLVHMAKRVIDVSRELQFDSNYPASYDGLSDAIRDEADLTVDIGTVIHLPTLSEPVSSNVEVEFYKTSDFMKLPYERKLGVVIPEEIIDTQETFWAFACRILDPCEDLDEFRKRLSDTYDK